MTEHEAHCVNAALSAAMEKLGAPKKIDLLVGGQKGFNPKEYYHRRMGPEDDLYIKLPLMQRLGKEKGMKNIVLSDLKPYIGKDVFMFSRPAHRRQTAAPGTAGWKPTE